MLDYKIINYKKIVRRNNSEPFIDLMSKTFNKDLAPSGGLLRVTKDYIARPDLISQAYYQDDKYADILCKINGISNPFELNEGDMLLIPPFEYILKCSKNFDFGGGDFVKEDDEIGLKGSPFQKKKSDKRSANEQLVNEKSYVIDKSMGIVFY